MSLGPCYCYTKEEFGIIGRRVKRKRNSPKSEVRQKPEKQLTTLRSCELGSPLSCLLMGFNHWHLSDLGDRGRRGKAVDNTQI